MLLHVDALVAVDPAAGLDVDRLAGLERLLEDVAVAVQPDDALVVLRLEAVDEEAGPAEEHVGDALDPVEGVVDVGGRREELVLADEDRPRPARRCSERTWPGWSREKASSPGDWSSVMKIDMPRDDALEALQRVHPDLRAPGSFQRITWCSK